jgi:hypothetical protein
MKPQDLDQLSLYLDNALPASQRVALEARLAAEPELRAALAELRLTVSALRGLPSLRPPRSFTLSPAQASVPARADRRPGFGAFSALRLATALAAIVLVFTVAGDFASTRLAPAATNLASAPATEVAALEAPAPAGTEFVIDLTAEAERTTAADAANPPTGGAGGAAEAQSVTPEPLPMATAAPQGTLAPPAALPPTATPDMAALGVEAPTETPAAEDTRTMAPTPEPSPKARPTEEGLQGAAGDEDVEGGDATATGLRDDAAAPTLPPIRIVEMALAALTVLFGLGAWLARRR